MRKTESKRTETKSTATVKSKKRLSVKGGTRLIIQPEDGIATLLEAINNARHSIEIVIFRFDRAEIEQALIAAVGRGVVVQALIACTNRGGEGVLRRLETRLLATGVTVSRTSDDLARYHSKMMIVDKKQLYLLAFNFTSLDIKSRSFGIITDDSRFLREAGKLFEADSNRKSYSPGLKTFVVSPANSREELASFLKRAKKEVLIYDPGLGDPQMVRILEERSRAGVKIRIIGALKRASPVLSAAPLAQLRLHTRTIVRDHGEVFVGSQSLRAPELDARREVGLIVADKRIASAIVKVFEDDWKLTQVGEGKAPEEHLLGDKLAKKVAKAMTRELPPVGDVIDSVAKDNSPAKLNLDGVDMESLEESVRDAVKTVVKETIQEAANAQAGS
jgi:cardiolipin synthase A/B